MILSFSSQSLETLFSTWCAHFFPQKPYTTTVVVPTPSKHAWLIERITQEKGIFFGVQVCTLQQWIAHLSQKYPPSRPLPHYFDLSLALMQQPTLYTLPMRQHERLCQQLYRSLLLHNHHIVDPRYRHEAQNIAKRFLSWQDWIATLPKELPGPAVHFFGFDLLWPHQRTLIEKMLCNSTTTLFLSVPSRMFWADTPLSNTHAAWFESNRLLANFGRGQRYINQWVSTHQGEEIFTLAKPWRKEPRFAVLDMDGVQTVDAPKNWLTGLRADILAAATPQCPQAFMPENSALAIYPCVDRLRQVLLIFDTIVHWIGHEKKEPRNIRILAPDMDQLWPLLTLIQRQRYPSIALLHATTHQNYDQWIDLVTRIYTLHTSDWSIEELEELFTHPLFLQQTQLTQEEAQECITLLRSNRVTWGIDSKHRQCHTTWKSASKSNSRSRTLEEGITLFIEQLTQFSDTHNYPWSTTGAAFHKGILALQNLVDLTQPGCEDTDPTFLLSLIEKIVESIEPHDTLHENKQRLLAVCRELSSKCHYALPPEKLLALWQAKAKEHGAQYTPATQAIVCASLNQYDPVPTDKVVLADMGVAHMPTTFEEGIPEEYTALNSMRSQILSWLLQTKENLLITYGTSSEEQSPCLPVQELIHWCDRAFGTTPLQPTFHTHTPWDNATHWTQYHYTMAKNALQPTTPLLQPSTTKATTITSMQGWLQYFHYPMKAQLQQHCPSLQEVYIPQKRLWKSKKQLAALAHKHWVENTVQEERSGSWIAQYEYAEMTKFWPTTTTHYHCIWDSAFATPCMQEHAMQLPPFQCAGYNLEGIWHQLTSSMYLTDQGLYCEQLITDRDRFAAWPLIVAYLTTVPLPPVLYNATSQYAQPKELFTTYTKHLSQYLQAAESQPCPHTLDTLLALFRNDEQGFYQAQQRTVRRVWDHAITQTTWQEAMQWKKHLQWMQDCQDFFKGKDGRT